MNDILTVVFFLGFVSSLYLLGRRIDDNYEVLTAVGSDMAKLLTSLVKKEVVSIQEIDGVSPSEASKLFSRRVKKEKNDRKR